MLIIYSFKSNLVSNGAHVISSSAKVVILRPNTTPKTEGVYEFQLNSDNSNLDLAGNDVQGIEKLGEVVGVTEYLIEIRSDQTYNYLLEVRDGGILIKPKNQNSFSYAETNKAEVIDKAMEAVEKNFGIPTFQIKTIVIDLLTIVADIAEI